MPAAPMRAPFDLRSAPDPSLVDLRSVTVAASHYTADLADAGTGDLGALTAQVHECGSRVRELRGRVPVLLVAHSTAGLAARAFAAANPSLVGGLITLGTPHGPAPLSALQDAAADRRGPRGVASARRRRRERPAAGCAVAPVVRGRGLGSGLDRQAGERAPLSRCPASPAPTVRRREASLHWRWPVLAGGADRRGSAAASALATQAATVTGPTHVAFGVRTSLTASPTQPGDVRADLGVRLDAFRVRLADGAAEPERPAHRIDVELRLDRPDGWLVDAGPLRDRARGAAASRGPRDHARAGQRGSPDEGDRSRSLSTTPRSTGPTRRCSR